MIQVNVHEAKSQLSKLIESALAGEQVTIARAGTPVVDLVRHPEVVVTIGVAGWEAFDVPDEVFDGDDPDVQRMFYGESAR